LVVLVDNHPQVLRFLGFFLTVFLMFVVNDPEWNLPLPDVDTWANWKGILWALLLLLVRLDLSRSMSRKNLVEMNVVILDL
jgi:hypothetical protein